MSPGRTKNIDVAQGQASAALDSYLTSGAKLQDAVSRFTRPVSDLHDHATADESSIGNALDALWTAILNTVLSTPYTDPKQDRLVSFINAIKSLPPPGQHRPQIWGLSLWPDLPILGATMRERWNIGPST
jgi:hypothetical protein